MSAISRPVLRLAEDGEITPLIDGAGWRAPVVLLARGLCSFSYFPTQGLRPGAARDAARLKARTAAPFTDPGFALSRGPDGYGVWWWDAARVSALLGQGAADRVLSLMPETLAQPRAEGWRIVALADGGAEAQVWRGGALVASQWRRAPFDDPAWRAFVRGSGEGSDEPSRPAPFPLAPSRREIDRAHTPLSDLTANDILRLSAAGLAGLFIAAAAFNLGQGIRRNGMADDTAARLAKLSALAPPASARAGVADLKRMKAFRDWSGRPQGLPRLALALDVLAEDEITPVGVEMDGSRLTLDVPYASLDRLATVADQLRSEAGFHDIRPISDAAQKVVHLQMSFGVDPAPAPGSPTAG